MCLCVYVCVCAYVCVKWEKAVNRECTTRMGGVECSCPYPKRSGMLVVQNRYELDCLGGYRTELR